MNENNWKKIDLHTHIEGDNGRQITIEEYIKIIKDNNVGLVSMTEHNKINSDKYEKIREAGINCIEGVELNVKFLDIEDYKHIIIYSERENFIKNSITSKIEVNDAIQFDELKLILEEAEHTILISIHYKKDNKRSLSLDEIESHFEFVKNNPWLNLMLECPSLDKVNDYQSEVKGKFHISAFSDIKLWDEYNESAKSLPSFEFEIKNLKEYCHWFVKTKVSSSSATLPDPINLSLNEEGEIIEISKGLNIIFGAKGSGKTKLIKDIYNKNINSFKSLVFNDSTRLEGLNDLYKKLKSEALDTKLVNSLEEKVKKLNTKIIDSEPQNNKFEFSSKAYIATLKTYLKQGEIKNIQKKIAFLQENPENKNRMKEQDELFANIDKFATNILTEIKKGIYAGKITNEKINNIRKINIDDWINTKHLHFYDFKEKFKKSLSDGCNVVSKQNLDFVKIVNNIDSLISFALKFIKEYQKIEQSETEWKLVNNDLLNEEYIFTAKLIKRENKNKSNDDHEGIPITKHFEKFNKLLQILKGKNIREYYEFLKLPLDEMKWSDSYNIVFNSKFKGMENYIPSSGQIDILILNYSLRNEEKDIIIDEFCNNLDNEFVFKTMVPLINETKKTIIATTHNPIIAIIPKVSKYIFLDATNDYLRYETNRNIFDGFFLKTKKAELVTKPMGLEEMLAKIIEGTKGAFILRKEQLWGLKIS